MFMKNMSVLAVIGKSPNSDSHERFVASKADLCTSWWVIHWSRPLTNWQLAGKGHPRTGHEGPEGE